MFQGVLSVDKEYRVFWSQTALDELSNIRGYKQEGICLLVLV
ncbi:hypothetical protein SB48_HM08orf05247 [Heyndrickxia coagulans]|uniref:Uncharacterized protein n=1 Tax=Heyndrickxia coagulans TaxID=1398 RepID=A0AAN0WD37_HEYCO|nr:hypothetical protein SB48_HM08orf05247 [Heyndrickxia coagulans]